MRAHEIRQGERCIGKTREQRNSGIGFSDRFTGIVVESGQAVAVAFSFHSGIEENLIEAVRVQICTDPFCKIHEKLSPGIQVGSAGIAVHHGHRQTCGRGYHVNFRMKFLELLFQHDHGEHRSAGRNITGTGKD